MNHNMVKSQFLSDSWCIIEEGFSSAELANRESVFSLGNGYIGLRGNLEEGGASGSASIGGSYLNGVFDSSPITYGEYAYGYAENNQTICNVADAKGFTLIADGEPLDMGKSHIIEHHRTLDMTAGLLCRDFVWETTSGCKLKIKMRRLVSLTVQQQAFAACRVEALEGNCTITIASDIRPGASTDADATDPRKSAGKERMLITAGKGASGQSIWMLQTTANTQRAIACAAEHSVAAASVENCVTENASGACYTAWAKLSQGQTLTLEKCFAYFSGSVTQSDALLEQARLVAKNGMVKGLYIAEQEQQAYLKEFWSNAAIRIESDDATLQGLRFNMFHLLQSAGRDGKTNIAAKGLTGVGYEGHYFWDTEAYIFPFFLHTEPATAKKLLEYRFSILDKARNRARTMGHAAGALFPWRTIGGEECSAYYPAGTAQYHINADIARAVQNYVSATGDDEFLLHGGMEILVETARLWYDLGFFNPQKDGMFCINCVTGPDEYNVLVNNNVYTNLMARENLLAAIRSLDFLKRKHPGDYEMLCKRIALAETEPAAWQEACNKLYIPYDDKTGLFPQDDGFFDRKPWPIQSIPQETFPLLLHYHPLVIYRHQICKQADLVLAMVLLGDQFTMEQKKANFAFYDRVTTHDSSLSMAVFSILASEIGERETAYRYFIGTARMDLDNTQRNTKDGLHMANMAGTWLCLTQGFGGMRIMNDMLCFSPYLPACWKHYGFCVRFRGRTVDISMGESGAQYRLLQGKPMTIIADGHPLELG